MQIQRMKLLSKIAIISGLALVLGCAAQSTRKDDSLYQDLGGNAGIDAIIVAILDRIYADERIAFFFQNTDRPDQHKVLVEQICDLTGGPCVYQGLNMIDAHGGLEIKYSEFDIFVEDVILGLQDAGVPITVQNRLLGLLAPMRADIVLK